MKRIGFHPNEVKDPSFKITGQVVRELLIHGFEVCVTEEVSKALSIPGLLCVDYDGLFENEILMTLGGDGTILKLAAKAAEKQIPVLGVNLGRVGYLAEVEWCDFSYLDSLRNDSFSISKRMMLEVLLNGEKIGTALNDVCLASKRAGRMTDFNLSSDRQEKCSYRADGMIIATPTGSTAYSLSAGGAVIDPKMRCISATPVCPIFVDKRSPLVFSEKSEIILDSAESREGVLLTIDGDREFGISPRDEIVIKESNIDLLLVELRDYCFYTNPSKKFHSI